MTNTKDPQLVSAPDVPAIVAVALEFAPPAMTSEDIVLGIMRALKGMANPRTVKDEIARQRQAQL